MEKPLLQRVEHPCYPTSPRWPERLRIISSAHNYGLDSPVAPGLGDYRNTAQLENEQMKRYV